MLRITLSESENGTAVRLAGHLAGESVAEARKVCLAADPPLLIDATELRDADSEGLTLLAELLERGANIEHLTTYLAMRLEEL